ncbi:hypothetical protein HMPREF9136_1441 [Prevotella dentalis DSM 3688]|uniref:Uncharacterized protein n=1 Tax=Prevotella dentalis (strain ATCC 49559 / DSM 3688 / JCM 13448 / NCTC 12043 / ES 2772) TaxID=908937 RepID=F9D3L3_PREDD|nr:hypothetical protein HMPREF9136_1441 [Prevotella dentalis DSM 3688]
MAGTDGLIQNSEFKIQNLLFKIQAIVAAHQRSSWREAGGGTRRGGQTYS